MAEGILRSRISVMGLSDIQVSSMGIHGLDGRPASGIARQVCLEKGIDISNHISRQINPDELFKADFIFPMEQVHKEFIKIFFPRVSEKVFLLAAWPGDENRKTNIEDPMGGGQKAFRRTFDKIAAHIDRILPELTSIFSNRV
jgi:protein-tyrosine phosphatase